MDESSSSSCCCRLYSGTTPRLNQGVFSRCYNSYHTETLLLCAACVKELHWPTSGSDPPGFRQYVKLWSPESCTNRCKSLTFCFCFCVLNESICTLVYLKVPYYTVFQQFHTAVGGPTTLYLKCIAPNSSVVLNFRARPHVRKQSFFPLTSNILETKQSAHVSRLFTVTTKLPCNIININLERELTS